MLASGRGSRGMRPQADQIEAVVSFVLKLYRIVCIDNGGNISFGRSLRDRPHVYACPAQCAKESRSEPRRAGHIVADNRQNALIIRHFDPLNLSTGQLVGKCFGDYAFCSLHEFLRHRDTNRVLRTGLGNERY